MKIYKKLAISMFIVFCLAFGAFVYANAQTWYTANQATVAWDAVAPVVSTDTIKYQVYTKVGATGTPVKVGGEITALQLTITFNIEGRYFIGVDAVRYPTGETVGIRSDRIAWSDVATDCSSVGPFGVVYFVSPATPKNLKRVP